MADTLADAFIDRLLADHKRLRKESEGRRAAEYPVPEPLERALAGEPPELIKKLVASEDPIEAAGRWLKRQILGR